MENSRPSAAEAEEAELVAEHAEHHLEQAQADHAEHGGDHEGAELVADLDVEELVGRERAGERGEGADHGLHDDAAALPNDSASMNLLNAPSATPSRAANASTSAGLITRLNELTIDSPKAPSEPTSSAPGRARRCLLARC